MQILLSIAIPWLPLHPAPHRGAFVLFIFFLFTILAAAAELLIDFVHVTCGVRCWFLLNFQLFSDR